jgi:hypothetical protein
MYLMYVDESGDSGLTNSPTDFFALSALVVHEQDWRTLVDSLVAFRKTLKGAYGLPIRTEIHASEYIKHSVHGLPRYVRLAILRNTLDELAKFVDVSITSVIIDKRTKTAPYDVFDMAWKTLFQRFENTLQYGNFPGGHQRDMSVIYTDATAGKKLTQLVRKMGVYNPIPNAGGGGYRQLPITKIIEDPTGKDSADSLLVQMADVCAYFLMQRFKPNAYIKKQKAEYYYDRLQPVLNTKASRTSPLGIVEL